MTFATGINERGLPLFLTSVGKRWAGRVGKKCHIDSAGHAPPVSARPYCGVAFREHRAPGIRRGRGAAPCAAATASTDRSSIVTAGRDVYQFDSVARRGRLAGPSRPEPAERRLQAVPEARRSTRGVFTAEQVLLGALDLGVAAALAVAVGITWLPALVLAVGCVAGLALAGLYRPRLRLAVLDDLPRAVLAVGGVGAVATWAGLPVTLTRVGALLAAVVVGRALLHKGLRWRRRRAPGEPAVVIGYRRSGGAARRGAPRGPHLRPDAGRLRRPAAGDRAGTAGAGARRRSTTWTASSPATGRCTWWWPSPAHRTPTWSPRCGGAGGCGVTVLVVPRLFELAVGLPGAEMVHGIPLVRHAAGAGADAALGGQAAHRHRRRRWSA